MHRTAKKAVAHQWQDDLIDRTVTDTLVESIQENCEALNSAGSLYNAMGALARRLGRTVVSTLSGYGIYSRVGLVEKPRGGAAPFERPRRVIR